MTPPQSLPIAPVRRPTPARLHWCNPGALAERTHLDALLQARPHVRGTVLDVGCGRQPYRHLFTTVDIYIGMDLPSAPADAPVDVYGTVEMLPIRTTCIDTVLCVQVFDFMWQPHRCFQELARVLRPGGRLVMITSQANREHDAPHDLFRVTRHGLSRLAQAAGLEVERLQPRRGFWVMIGHSCSLYLWRHLQRWRVGGKPLVAPLCAVVQGVCHLLDRVHDDPEDALGHMLIAWKPSA